MKILSSLIAAATSVVFVSADAAVSATDLQHNHWVLQSINDEPLAASEGRGGIPELQFDELMRVSGNTGCNRINGQAKLDDGAFLIEAMISTRMMCPPPWRDIELIVQSLLSSESSITLDADNFLILEAINTRLVFCRQK